MQPGGGRILGLAPDRLLALYLIVAAPALLWPHRPAAWPLLLAAHALVVALAWPVRAVEARVRALTPRAQHAIRTVADWAPLVLIMFLYRELAVLNTAVHGGHYFDAVIIGWEQTLFGGQPSRDWAQAMPWLSLSEPLHAAYLSYYFIIFVPPLLLFLRGQREEFRAGVFALLLTFFVHYVCFIYFPVQGPRYLFPPPTADVSHGFFVQLAHGVLEAGSARGAAFPSSHVGVAVAQTLIVWRYLPRLAPLFAVLSIGLALGAVYGGFHYVTDVAAGCVLGAAAFMLAAPLQKRLSAAR